MLYNKKCIIHILRIHKLTISYLFLPSYFLEVCQLDTRRSVGRTSYHTLYIELF